MLSSALSSRPLSARAAIVGSVITALVALLLLGTAPLRASADDVVWTTVTDEASLQAALTADAPDIMLANDITVQADSLTDSFAAIINLQGHNLTTKNLTTVTSGRLELVSVDAAGDPVDGGSVIASSPTPGLAAITVDQHAQFYATGISVTANGETSGGGAGIGGDNGKDSGYISIADTTVTATGAPNAAAIGGGDQGDVSAMITITDSDVTATAGSNAAAIGGGRGGSVNAAIDVDGGSTNNPTVTLSAADASVIGAGVGGAITAPGVWDLGGNVDLESPNYLTVPDDEQYYDFDGTLSGTGALHGSGSILNHGVISLSDANVGSVSIVEHAYNVDFNADTGGTPQDQYVHVYAPTFNQGKRAAPPIVPLAAAQVFSGWYQADRTTPFSLDDVLVPGSEYLAVYTQVMSLAITPPIGVISAGDSANIQVIGSDASANTSDQSQFAHLVSNNPTDVITGDSITFGVSGTRTITADIPGYSGLNTTAVINVVGGTMSKLTLTPSSSTATAGNTVTFATEGFDAGGDDFGDQSSAATLTSNVASDVVDNSAHTVTFGAAGTHIITATIGALTNTASIEVTAATPKTMSISPTKFTATAGIAQAFTITGVNSLGTPLGDISNQAVWSGLASSDTRVGNKITFGAVGTRTIKATVGKVSISTTVTVVHGALARLAFYKPTTSATAGTTKTFVLKGYDSKNNYLGVETSHVTLTLAAIDSGKGEHIAGASVKFTDAGSRTLTATDGAITVDTHVTVGATTPSVVLPSATVASTVAGTTVAFTVAGQDVYGNPIANITSSTAIHSKVASDKISKNKVSFTWAGTHHLTFTDGKATGSLDFVVTPAVVVPGKLTFNFPNLTAYPNLYTTDRAWTSDRFGNGIAQLDTTHTSAGVATSYSFDEGSAIVDFFTLGHHTVTASAAGYTSISETFNVIRDTTHVTFPTAPITASIASDITLHASIGVSNFSPSGTVTLHFGSSSVHAALAAEGTNPSDVTLPLPALKVGSYTFYATYSGDGQYNSYTSPKVTVKVVPGPLDHLAFVKPPTKVTAGGTVTYSVLGYDFFGNLIGSETSHTALSLDTVGAGESVTGAKVKFTQAGVRVVTATVGSVTKTVTLTVAHNVAAHLSVTYGADAVAGVPYPFTATATDAYGNPLGDVTTLLTGSSTVSSDHFVKNVGTFTRAGDRTITFKDGAASESFPFSVDHASEAPNKWAFVSSSTHAFAHVATNFQIATSDVYGNPITPIASAVYTATGSGNTIDNPSQTIILAALGAHTITGSFDGFHVSKVVTVVKDNAVVTWPTGAVNSNATTPISIEVSAGPSGAAPTGTVTLHYGSHSLSAALASGEASLVLPAISAGSYVFYVTYSGDSTYNSKTTGKVTVHATPVV